MSKKIALTLSGGGARGFFHLGVLKALRELNIEVARVNGTSAGALAGAFHCAGYSPEETAEILTNVDIFKLFRLAFRWEGLISTKPLFKVFAPYFEEDSFESLKKPFTAAVVDLVEGTPHYFDKGPLLKPMIASCAVPVIFEPVEINGKLYVDGGPIDNMPVHNLDKKEYHILGSVCNYIGRMESKINLLTATERSFFLAVNANVQVNRHKCDLVFEHEGMGKFRASDINGANEMMEYGYESVMVQKEALAKLN